MYLPVYEIAACTHKVNKEACHGRKNMKDYIDYTSFITDVFVRECSISKTVSWNTKMDDLIL